MPHKNKTMTQGDLIVFFRNDDVRNVLDESLISLTSLCIKHRVPISHAVEPGNVTSEVAEWLIGEKKKHPELIEIIQHGYNHNLSNPSQKMEFGGTRNFEDQYEDLKKGKAIMDQLFGGLWSPVFTFPFGTYNKYSLQAINQLGYKAISSKMQFSAKVRLKNFIGKSLGKDMLLGKKINYHPDIRKGYSIREISVSANLIKKYTGESEADHFSLEEIKNQIAHASEYTEIIGVLFHHRFHKEHLGLTEDLIVHLKKEGFKFKTIAEIIG